MIAKMTQYSFILLHGDKEQFLSELQALGLVDIQRSAKPVDSYSQGLLDSIATLRHDIENMPQEVEKYVKHYFHCG